MHSFLVATISVLVVLGIMVLVHEFGHFLAAKLFGVRVEQFSIGFPPRLVGFKIGETDYCISATPLGGYVKMTGESMPGENMSLQGADGETIAAHQRDPGALTSHPRWQRIIIGLAGPFSNFVLAVLLMTVFYMRHNEVPLFVDLPVTLDWVVPGSAAANAGIQPGDYIQTFDGKENPTWEELFKGAAKNLNHSVSLVAMRNGKLIPLTMQVTDDSKGKDFSLDKLGIYPVEQPGPVKVASVPARTPAATAGIQPGDEFLAVDGHAFHGTQSIISYLQQQKGAPVSIQLKHAGKVSTVGLTPIRVDDPKQGSAWRIGFSGTLPPSRVDQLPVNQAFRAAAKFTRNNSLDILDVLKRVLSHRMSVDNLSGPIGIAQQTGQAWDAPGWDYMIQLMAVISLNLGILNLLPFPILDGGMILFLLIESLIRRDIDMQIKERVYQVAFVLILIFAAYIIFNDISKLSIFGQTHS